MMDLEPCYNFESSTDYVSLLRDVPCSFTSKEKGINCKAEIVLDADCSVDFRIEIPLDMYESFSFTSSILDIKRINLDGKEIPAFISQVSPSTSGKAIVTFSPNNEPVPLIGCDETRLSKVIFHLFNFKDEKGTTRKVIRSENSGYSLGVTELISERWKIELHEIKKSDKAKSQKKHSSTLSHVCCLTRSDGSEFDGKAAQQMLLNLRLFFTFSQGAFCPPVMPVGYDTNDKKVWAIGSSPHSPDSSMSWFDQHHSEELARLFPGFMSRLEDERWRETLHTVIYWGARSNNTSGSGIDTGIILAQIAIERLAYEYSIDSHDKDDPKAFSKLTRASDKFRFLFSRLEIPQEIPDNFIKIRELAKQEGFADAPYFLTELRNSMVHPANKRRHLFTGLYPDAWRLGMWYLELAILRICDYEGTYANRLSDNHWVGQVEDVPWTKKPDNP